MSKPAEATPQQQKVIDGVKGGKTPDEIAKELKISRNGVYAHIRRLRAKGLLPKSSAKRSGSRKPAAKRGAAASRNGRSGSARSAPVTAVIKAMRKANADAQKRLVQIDAERAALDAERAAIVEEAARVAA